MNKVIIIGRLVKDVDLKYTTGDNQTAVARFTVAVDRKYQKKEEKKETDFISCIAWSKNAEFISKYFGKGNRIAIEGRIQTGSYEKDGQRIYTTDVVVESQEFVENKSDKPQQASNTDADGFMNIPDGIDEELPFN